MRCAIYCRVSTPGQLNGSFTSLDSQKGYCEAFVKSQAGKGWHCVPDEYADPGFSGTTLDRPGLKKLLADVDNGKIDTVVVYRFDRISRNTRDFHNLIDHLEQRDVSFVSVSEQVNTSEPSGQVMRSIMMSFAQFERDVIAQRTRDKISAAKRQGRWCGGHTPLGYQVLESGGGLSINPNESTTVAAIFDLYLKLQSLRAVAEELNRRGWLTKKQVTKTGSVWGGKPWTKTIIHNHITNPLYVGLVRHNGETYDGQHKAIISKRIWNKVQALLKANCRNGGASTKNKHGHLLRGILYCNSCDAVMNPTASKRGDRIYRYMVCSAAAQKGWHSCPTPSVSAPAIEEFVRKNIAVIGSDPKLQQETVKQVRKAMKTGRPALRSERKRLQTQRTKAQAEIDHLVSALASGRSQSVTGRLNEVEGLVATMDRRIAEIDLELASTKAGALDEGRLTSAMKQFTPIWDLLFPMEQERLIQLIVDRVEFSGKGADVAISYRPTGLMALAGEITEPEEATA